MGVAEQQPEGVRVSRGEKGGEFKGKRKRSRTTFWMHIFYNFFFFAHRPKNQPTNQPNLPTPTLLLLLLLLLPDNNRHVAFFHLALLALAVAANIFKVFPPGALRRHLHDERHPEALQAQQNNEQPDASPARRRHDEVVRRLNRRRPHHVPEEDDASDKECDSEHLEEPAMSGGRSEPC